MNRLNQLVMLQRQQGSVLVIGLIFVVLLTLIGMQSINDTQLQERMAGNLRDRNAAFQAAEAALRTAEAFLADNELIAFDGTLTGYWPDLGLDSNRTALKNSSILDVENMPPFWTEQQWNDHSLSIPNGTIENVNKQPRYTIEKMMVNQLVATQGSGIDVESQEKFAAAEYYRITARGFGITESSSITLQSTYIP